MILTSKGHSDISTLRPTTSYLLRRKACTPKWRKSKKRFVSLKTLLTLHTCSDGRSWQGLFSIGEDYHRETLNLQEHIRSSDAITAIHTAAWFPFRDLCHQGSMIDEIYKKVLFFNATIVTAYISSLYVTLICPENSVPAPHTTTKTGL